MATESNLFIGLAKLFDEWNKGEKQEKSEYQRQLDEWEKSWKTLVDIDLRLRKRKQTERKWNPPLTSSEIEGVESIKPNYSNVKEHIEKLKNTISALENRLGVTVSPLEEEDY